MRLFALLLSAPIALAVAKVVDRRQIADIPGLPIPLCALYCVTSVTNAGPANCADNAACLCVDSGFGQSIASCISLNCNATDIGSAVQFAKEYCSSAGVSKISIPLSYTIFSSTFTSTSTAPATSSASVSTSNAGALSIAPSASTSGSGSSSGSVSASSSVISSASVPAATASASASTSNAGALSIAPSASVSATTTSASTSSSAPATITGLPVPQCALNCVTAVTNAGSASCADNAACLCPEPAFLQSMSSCMYSNCNVSDVPAALQFAKEYCSSAGVTISLSIPSASGSATPGYLGAAANASSTTTTTAAMNTSAARALGYGYVEVARVFLVGMLTAVACITVL